MEQIQILRNTVYLKDEMLATAKGSIVTYKADEVAELAKCVLEYLKPLVKDFNDGCDSRCFPKALPEWAQEQYDKGTTLIAELEQIVEASA